MQLLGRDSAAGPAQAPGNRHQAGQDLVNSPRADDEDQAGKGQSDSRTLESANTFSEKGPSKQQQPERHRVCEDRRLAGTRVGKSPHGEADESSRLKKAHDEREARSHQAYGAAQRHQQDEQAANGEDGTQSRKSVGLDVVEPYFRDRPAVAPYEGKRGERRRSQLTTSCIPGRTRWCRDRTSRG